MNYKDCEQYWRDKLSSEIKKSIDEGSEINAYGAYLIIRGSG